MHSDKEIAVGMQKMYIVIFLTVDGDVSVSPCEGIFNSREEAERYVRQYENYPYMCAVRELVKVTL